MKLGNYKHLKIKQPDISVSEKELNHALQALQAENSVLIRIDDRPVQEGDQVIIDFQGFIDETPIPNGSRKRYSLTLGSHSFIQGFEEQIIGHQIGDEFDIHVRFPEKYPTASAAGKEARFHIILHSAGIRILQQLDDEFARDFSEYSTMDMLKETILENLEDKKAEQADEKIRKEILTKIIQESEIEDNPDLIAQLMDEYHEEFLDELAQQGMTEEQFLQRTKQTSADILKRCEAKARRSLQETSVLNAVAEAENLSLTKEELDEAISDLAFEYDTDPDEFLEMLDPEELDGLKLELLCDKAMARILSLTYFIS